MESHHAMRSIPKKRTTNFREDETKLLIQLWGSPQIQNKLYLTHRKAPVMRILAANMQRHGFYRTPDEIKTRIRNLKCLYHRIKRTVQSGTGVGTVDPDWPHYKAMDSILSKDATKKDLYKDNVLEGPRCEDIKQEIEDIDINDDMESYSTLSNHGSDYGEDTNLLPSLTPAPQKEERPPPTPQKILPAIMPNLANFAIPISAQQSNQNGRPNNGMQSLPFPLLIVQPKPQSNDHKNLQSPSKMPKIAMLQGGLEQHPHQQQNFDEIGFTLKEMLNVQKENLAVEKERLSLEKEKFDFHKSVSSQLLTLFPIFGTLLQQLVCSNNETATADKNSTKNERNGRKRKSNDNDILKDSKILKMLLEKNIKRYMLEDEDKTESDKDDSGLDLSKDEPEQKN